MDFSELHRWDVSKDIAIKIQEELSKKVIFEDIKISDIKTVAAADCNYVIKNQKLKEIISGSVVVFSYRKLKLLEEVNSTAVTNSPYISSLLAFREAPVLLECFKKIKIEPDIILFDGHGIAHPRRIGIASHLGIILNKPTIGVAKKKLIGEYVPPPNKPLAYTYLYDNKEKIGIVLRSKKNANPIFISPGYKINLITSKEIVINLLRGHRLPEPLRIAHIKNKVITYNLEETVDSINNLQHK